MNYPTIKATLRDWAVHSADTLYIPPELAGAGIVSGFPNPPVEVQCVPFDGRIETSPLVRVEGRVVWTASGSGYFLGRVSPAYRRWLRKNGIPYDPEHPIRIKERTLT